MHYAPDITSLLCHELIGRERELYELHETLQQAASGRPQLVLLSGEAGLGKTKLCRSFIESSQVQQTLVLFGQAIPQDQTLPFSVFLDAFRRYFTAGNRSTSTDPLHTTFAFLFQLLPELAPLFPEVTPPTFDTKGTIAQHRQAMFHSILIGLQSLAQNSQGPLLLILEDLHWADETSLDLLAFLARRLDIDRTFATGTDKSTSLFILGTYRAEALSNNPALGHLLGQLRAQRQVKEMRLSPLNPVDHRRCVSSILGQPVSEEFVSLLFAWDEGNPFFTEELLGAMDAAGQLDRYQAPQLMQQNMRLNLPTSLTAAIIERLKRLPAVDQKVLTYAAIIGREFDFVLLTALSGLDERKLVTVLRRAKNAQLLNEVGQPVTMAYNEQNHYQFRHALIRETIYDQMLICERRLYHRIVAETIEKLVAHAPPTERDKVNRLLAEQYWLAGMAEQARPYLLREAERSSRIFAFREERYYLYMAQASFPENSPERLDLLQRLGVVSLAVFDFSGALQWLAEAKSGYQRIGQQYRALQVLAMMLFPTWVLAASPMSNLQAEIEVAAEATFANAVITDRDVEILTIYAQTAAWWIVDGKHDRATLWIERSMTLFESLTDPRKVGCIQLSLLLRGWIKTHGDNATADEGLTDIRNVLSFALRYSLPDLIMGSYDILTLILIHLGRRDEVERLIKEINDYEIRSGSPRQVYLIAWYDFFFGERWEQEIELLRRDIEWKEQANIPTPAILDRVVLTHFFIARNELAAAQACLDAIQPKLAIFDQYLYLALIGWTFAKLYTAQGNPLQAEACYERVFHYWKTTSDSWFILPILRDGIEFYAVLGRLQQAQQWLTELQTLARVTGNPVANAALLEAQGVLHAVKGAKAQAIQTLRRAVESWNKLKQPYQQAAVSHRLADLLLDLASRETTSRTARQAAREEAEALLRSAACVYERLQIPHALEAVQKLQISTRLDAQRKRRSTLMDRRLPRGLTQREMQVLIQLAAGRTNKEMAVTLSISISTVEVHVTHILNKLGCETRTQAAASAVAQGWVPTEGP